ncbi:hypothetical protein ACP70R_044139 [Stipagrostis hirtigluma subsp. patula]
MTGRGEREHRGGEAGKGGTRTYKVLLDWPLMEIPCMLAFDSLPFPAVYDGQHCLEIQHNKSSFPLASSSHMCAADAEANTWASFVLTPPSPAQTRQAAVWMVGPLYSEVNADNGKVTSE